MASPKTGYSRRVCEACKSRKKACDKTLPSCGYCSRNGLTCHYVVTSELSSSSSTGDGSNSYGREQAWVIYTAAPWNPPKPPGGASRPFRPPSLAPGLSMQAFCSNSSSSTATLENSLHEYTCSVLRSQNASADSAIRQFLLGGVHKALPIVNPERLLLPPPSTPPPASFTLLLLAICLVTPPAPGDGHLCSSAMAGDELYQAVKGFLGQVQAIADPSPWVLDAAALVCAYEYASGRIAAAYVSIATCARMADVLGIDDGLGPNGNEDLDGSRKTPSNKTRWAIATLERLIASEALSLHARPAAGMPARRSLHLLTSLPIDAGSFHIASPFSFIDNAENKALVWPGSTATLRINNDNREESRLTQQAQATVFLDRVLYHVARDPETAADEPRLAELRMLNQQLLAFIASVMAGRDRTAHCGILATAFRALFLLHEHVLTVTDSKAPGGAGCGSAAAAAAAESAAALDAAARIVADVADDHVRTHAADSLPLCCPYNLRSATGHMEGKPSRDRVDSYMALEKIFSKRWGGRVE